MLIICVPNLSSVNARCVLLDATSEGPRPSAAVDAPSAVLLSPPHCLGADLPLSLACYLRLATLSFALHPLILKNSPQPSAQMRSSNIAIKRGRKWKVCRRSPAPPYFAAECLSAILRTSVARENRQVGFWLGCQESGQVYTRFRRFPYSKLSREPWQKAPFPAFCL